MSNRKTLFNEKFFNSIVLDNFSLICFWYGSPYRHGFAQARRICVSCGCMGRTAIHERRCDWCKLFVAALILAYTYWVMQKEFCFLQQPVCQTQPLSYHAVHLNVFLILFEMKYVLKTTSKISNKSFWHA